MFLNVLMNDGGRKCIYERINISGISSYDDYSGVVTLSKGVSDVKVGTCFILNKAVIDATLGKLYKVTEYDNDVRDEMLSELTEILARKAKDIQDAKVSWDLAAQA